MVKLKKRREKRGSKILTSDLPVTQSPIKNKPVFSFLYLSKSHCITKCQQKEKISFVKKMHLLSQTTWNQIYSSPAHKNGCEKISRDSLNVSVPQGIKDDANILSIRFFGKAPMVGFREDDIFHVIWFDRKFDVYDH